MPAPTSELTATAGDRVTEGLRLRVFGDPGGPSSAPTDGAASGLSTPDMMAERMQLLKLWEAQRANAVNQNPLCYYAKLTVSIEKRCEGNPDVVPTSEQIRTDLR